MKPLILLGFLTLALLGCNSSSEKGVSTDETENIQSQEKETLANWKVYEDANYTIQYPDTFELDQSGLMGTNLILFSKRSSLEDEFRENVNLLIQDLTGQDIDLDMYTDISENQIVKMITDGELLISERLEDDDKVYQNLVYTGRQGQFNLKWYQLYWIEDEKAYILTFTAEQDQYDRYAPVGIKIMESFVNK